MNFLHIRVIVTAAVCLSLAGCTTGFWRSVAEAETFNFRYVVAPPFVQGYWSYQIALDNGPCQPVTLSDAELKTMLETGTHVHAGVSYTFTPDMLTRCNSGRYYLDDEEIKNRRSFGKVNVDRKGGGANPSGLDIKVDATQMIVYNAGGPLVPGPMDASLGGPIELPAAIVGSSGAAFSPLNGPSSTQFLKFTLLDLLSNPSRISAEFMFVGQQPGSNLRLLVWDGEIVLQD